MYNESRGAGTTWSCRSDRSSRGHTTQTASEISLHSPRIDGGPTGNHAHDLGSIASLFGGFLSARCDEHCDPHSICPEVGVAEHADSSYCGHFRHIIHSLVSLGGPGNGNPRRANLSLRDCIAMRLHGRFYRKKPRALVH